jgi:uncharacterized protein YbjT (DUF2867 family)
MSDKKIIAVVGATGAQGGGLVRAILADPSGQFGVRAITRDASSEKAKALAAAGAEVVAASVDDFFWDHFSAEREMAQAKAMANAARTARLQHVIWSTLEDSRKFVPLDDDRMPTLQGKYKVPHFDAKGESDAYFAGLPTTYLLTSFYWDNFIHFGSGPQKGPDGTLGLVFPMADKKLPGIAAEDIGRCSFGIFQQGSAWLGKRVGIAGGHYTGDEMAAAMSKALGRPIRYNYVPPEIYRTFGFPGADDLANMFQFNRDFSDAFCAARDVAVSRSLNPLLQSLEDWLAVNGAAIPLPA